MDWEGVWAHLGATEKGLGLTGIDLGGILTTSPHRERVLQVWGLSALGVPGLRAVRGHWGWVCLGLGPSGAIVAGCPWAMGHIPVHLLQVFDSAGSFLSYINTAADPLYGPQGLALTSDGHVVVADSGNHCFKAYRYLQ